MAIEERAVRAPGPDDAVIEVLATGICGSDVHGFTGETGRRHADQVMGHETIGRVVEVGRNGRPELIDTMVAVNPVLGCGGCASCHGGNEQICEKLVVLGVAQEIDAAFAEFVTAPVGNLETLPQGMVPHHGALVEPLAVGYHAAVRGRAVPDDRVLVIGGGPIGQAVALGAQRLGVEQLVVSEPNSARRAALIALGFLALEPAELRERMGEAIGGEPTLVFDAVGLSATLADALTLSKRRARVVMIGMASPRLEMASYSLSVSERDVLGTFCYTAREFHETVEWAADNEATVNSLIDLALPLTDGPDTFRGLADGSIHANKILLLPAASDLTLT